MRFGVNGGSYGFLLPSVGLLRGSHGDICCMVSRTAGVTADQNPRRLMFVFSTRCVLGRFPPMTSHLSREGEKMTWTVVIKYRYKLGPDQFDIDHGITHSCEDGRTFCGKRVGDETHGWFADRYDSPITCRSCLRSTRASERPTDWRTNGTDDSAVPFDSWRIPR